MREEVHFNIPAVIRKVLKIRNAVDSVCLDMGFTPHDTNLILTAVWEAVLNAATHGSPKGETDRVLVDIIAEGDILHIDVTSCRPDFRLPDDRPVFNPLSKRGRGLPIMYAFMDEVSLTPVDNGVTLHLMKRIPSEKLIDNSNM